MSEALTVISLKKLFRFPFEAPKWASRFLVGAVLFLANYVVPIIPGIFVSGYLVRVLRQSVSGEDPQLPAWEEWGDLFKDGFFVTIISFVYFLPGMVVSIGGMLLYYVATFAVPLVAALGGEAEQVGVMIPLLLLVSMVILFVSMFVGMVLTILGAVAMPLATAHYVAEGSLGAAFRLRAWWRILRADSLSYLISWVVVAGLMMLLYMTSILAYSTLILCCLIPFLMAPAMLYLGLVGAALFGQTYRENAAAVTS